MKLICPICQTDLTFHEKNVSCLHGHAFDIAKQGYINLALRKNNAGDNLLLVESREKFLATRNYQFLADEILKIHQRCQAQTLVDFACGEAYYTSQFICPNIGIDLSVNALRRASKKDLHGKYILSSIYQVPLATGSCDFILTCFAPIAGEEIVRLLQKKGYFLLVRPAKKHLREIKEILYEKVIENEEKEITIPNLTLIQEYHIEKSVLLDQRTLHHLLYMTPYIYSTKKEKLSLFDSLSSLQVTFSFLLSLYQKD